MISRRSDKLKRNFLDSSTERDRLVAAALSLVADADAVILAGSSLHRSSALVADIDLIVFRPQASIEVVTDLSAPSSVLPINISIYHTKYFEAVATDPDLLFYNLREVRKLIFGIPIFDPNGYALTAIDTLRSSRLDKNHLLMLLSKIETEYFLFRNEAVYSLPFHNFLELAFFLAFHHRIDIYYSKHKYLREDAPKLEIQGLCRFLDLLADECVQRCDIGSMISTFENITSTGEVQASSAIEHLVGDAKKLLLDDRHLDAVFPLRFAAIRFLIALPCNDDAFECESSTSSFAGIVASFLMLGQKISNPVLFALDECLFHLSSAVRHVTGT